MAVMGRERWLWEENDGRGRRGKVGRPWLEEVGQRAGRMNGKQSGGEALSSETVLNRVAPPRRVGDDLSP